MRGRGATLHPVKSSISLVVKISEAGLNWQKLGRESQDSLKGWKDFLNTWTYVAYGVKGFKSSQSLHICITHASIIKFWAIL